MARYERSRDRKGSKGRFESSRKGFDNGAKRRKNPDRNFSRRDRELEMTKVTCSGCGSECEVPFKPTSSKPVYCRDCFSKKEKGGSNRSSGRSSRTHSNGDLDQINEKLNKIMKALKID